MLLTAALALLLAPAGSACEPPSGAKVLAESRKVVVWRSGKRVVGCATRNGLERHLFDLDPRLHEHVKLFLPGERVVAAFVADGFSEMALYRFTGGREPVLLSAGFGSVTELVRSREGHFAWIETKGRNGACSCSVVAGDGYERFVVARRSRRESDVRIAGSKVSFDVGGAREHHHVAFVSPHRIAVTPDPGDPHSHFKLDVALPRGIPSGGRTRADINAETGSGANCNGMTEHEPRVRVTRDGRSYRVTFTPRDPHWCIGSYHGHVTYSWHRSYITFGRFELRVR